MKPQIRIAAPAPASFTDTLKITFFDLSNRMKIVTIYKNSSATMILVLYPTIFFKPVVNRKEPELELEPQFVISTPAPGGNFIRLL
jgi:hypothetical protein